MNKVRFSCPRCQTVMQTNEDKIGFDIACPHCAYRFKLVEPSPAASSGNQSGTVPSIQSEQTMPPRSAPSSSNNPLVNVGASAGSNYASPHPARPPSTQAYPAKPQGSFQCPYCQTHAIPKMQSEISTAGWIVFGVLLVTTCVFCFVGFFIRDNFKVCSQCGIRL